MSDPKTSVDTNDIWIPPGVGYSEQTDSSLSLVVVVDDVESSLTLWGRTDVIALPGLTNPYFGIGDYAEHVAGIMSLDIVKIGGAPELIAGQATTGDRATRATRATGVGRGTPKDDPPQGAGTPEGWTGIGV